MKTRTWVPLVAAAALGAAWGAFHWRESSRPAAAVFADHGLEITDWSIEGPYICSDGADPWNANPAERKKGWAPAQSAARALAHLVPGAAWGQKEPHRQRVHSALIDFQDLYGFEYEPDPYYGFLFADFRVTADREREVQMMIGSSDGFRLWVNGEEVAGANRKRGLALYNDTVPVKLRRGENDFRLKVCRYRSSWGLAACLAPDAKSASLVSLRNEGLLENRLLAKNVFATGEAIAFLPKRIAPLLAESRVRLVDLLADREVPLPTLNEQSANLIADVSDGVYRLVVERAGESFSERFVVGDAPRLVALLRTRYEERRELAPLADVIEPHFVRLEVLLRKDNRPAAFDRAWDLKTAYSFAEIAALLARPADPGAGQGLKLLRFTSAADGHAQYVRLYVPRNAGKRPRPLLIFQPTVTSANRPFIESAFMADHQDAERLSVLAEKHGVILAWTGFRSQLTGSSVDLAHLEEALAAVEKFAPVDREAVTVVGACSGGAMAIASAAHWPAYFAGVALMDPSFELCALPTTAAREFFARSEGFGEWAGPRSPVGSFNAASDAAVLVVYDGTAPGHGNLQDSEKFVALARAAGKDIRFVRMAQPMPYHMVAWDAIFAWSAHARRVRPSASIARGRKPPESLLDVFAGPVVFVEGSGGTAADLEATARIVRQLRDTWRDAFFSELPLVRDVDWNAEDGRAVVAIGNEKTNSWIRARRGQSTHSWITAAAEQATIECFPLDSDGHKPAGFVVGAEAMARSLPLPVSLFTDGWFLQCAWRREADTTSLISVNGKAPHEI
jgi:hypothetical protein